MGHVTQDISVSSRVTELLSLDYADKLLRCDVAVAVHAAKDELHLAVTQ